MLAVQRKLDEISHKMDDHFDHHVVRRFSHASQASRCRLRTQSASSEGSSLDSEAGRVVPTVPLDQPMDDEDLEVANCMRRSSAPLPSHPPLAHKPGGLRALSAQCQRGQPSHSQHNQIQRLDWVLPNSTCSTGAGASAATSEAFNSLRVHPCGGAPAASSAEKRRSLQDSPPVEDVRTTQSPPDMPTQLPDIDSNQEATATQSNLSQASLQERENRQMSMASRFTRKSSDVSGDRVHLGRLRSWLNLGDGHGNGRNSTASQLIDRMGLRRLSTSASKFIESRWSHTQDGKLYKLVHGMNFQLLCSMMIVLNVIVIGVIANARLESGLARTEESPVWEYLEIAFCVFFGLELALRAIAEKVFFFCGPEWRWNVFDLLLVLFSIVDAVLISITSVAISNVTAARVLRFVRFIRIIRIARAVRAFHSLRIVVFAIFESMVSLIWCLLVVGLIIYMFAIFFLYGVTEHLTAAERLDDAHAKELLLYYGSVPTAVSTLFMTISGGVDWQDAMRPLEAIHWIYSPLFTFYVFLMVIGVLNVVMGAFVAATAEISNRDRDALVKAEMEQQQAYTRKIKAFFKEADRDKSGLLSWTEFKEHLKVPKVSAYFRALELDVSQAHVLFKLLDRDGSNEVSLDEFLAGCNRLKGQAKSLEVNMLLYENKRLFNKLSDFMEVIAEQLDPATPDQDSPKPLIIPQPSPFLDE